MDLPFVMGTELTGIHRLYREEERKWHMWAVHERKSKDRESVRRHLEMTHTGYYNIAFDDHCLEISSPKLKTFESYRAFSQNVRTIMANHDYYPKNPTVVCGGGHIHVGVPKTPWGGKFRYHVARDLIMRPYLPWVFGEPDEEDAMNVLINKANDYRLMDEIWQAGGDRIVGDIGRYGDTRFIKHLELPYNPRTRYVNMSNRHGGKTHMFMLTSYPTIEFRFFEMAPSWEDQELQMHFLIAYLNWMVKRLEREDYTDIQLITDEQMQAIEPGVCESLFEEMCYHIGVVYEDYEHIVERNLYPRWTNGRKRL
jgi:hypothetical protein